MFLLILWLFNFLLWIIFGAYYLIYKFLIWKYDFNDYMCPKCDTFPEKSYRVKGELYPKNREPEEVENELKWIEIHKCINCNRNFGFPNSIQLRR